MTQTVLTEAISTRWYAEIVRLRAIKARSFREDMDLIGLLGCVQGYIAAKAEAEEKRQQAQEACEVSEIRTLPTFELSPDGNMLTIRVGPHVIIVSGQCPGPDERHSHEAVTLFYEVKHDA